MSRAVFYGGRLADTPGLYTRAGFIASAVAGALAAILGFGVMPGGQAAATGTVQPAANLVADAAPHRLFAPAAAADARWTISDVVDPDEPLFDRNDIGRVRIAASQSTVRVRIETADGQPFEFDPSDAALRLEFFWWTNQELGEGEIVQVLVSAARIDAYWPSFGLPPVYSMPLTASGPAVSFELARSLFEGADVLDWNAFALDLVAHAALPPCDGPSCDSIPYDFAGVNEGTPGDYPPFAGRIELP